MDIEESLSQADLYIRQNQTAQARAILGQILRDNPQNEEAWILSAQVSDKPEQVIYCLRQALGINPASRARLLLERLQLPQTPPAPVISSQPESQPLPDTQPIQAIHPAAQRRNHSRGIEHSLVLDSRHGAEDVLGRMGVIVN